MDAIRRSTKVPAAADRVWEAVIAGDWIGDDVELDPRVGGEGYVLDHGQLRHVVIEAVEPGRRLAYRWWPLTPEGVGTSSRVTIDLEPEDDVTRVVVVEAPVSVAVPLPPAGPVALASV